MSLFDNQTGLFEAASFAKCPSCQQNFVLETENGKVSTKARKCKFCEVWIDESKIILSSSINQTLTQSLRSAEEIKGFNFAIPIIAGVVLFELLTCYLVKDEFPFLAHIVFIFTTVFFYSGITLSSNWLNKYKDIRIYDGELMAAKKHIKFSRIAWSAGVFFNIILWISYFVFIKYR